LWVVRGDGSDMRIWKPHRPPGTHDWVLCARPCSRDHHIPIHPWCKQQRLRLYMRAHSLALPG
jgi:hypothetical protein